MNDAAALVMTDVATVWEVSGTNEFGQSSFAAPYLIACNYSEGGKLQISDEGTEFMPAATFRTFDARPSRKSFIMQGDHTDIAAPVSGRAFQVRRLVTKTPFAPLGGTAWQQRYTYYTGG